MRKINQENTLTEHIYNFDLQNENTDRNPVLLRTKFDANLIICK